MARLAAGFGLLHARRARAAPAGAGRRARHSARLALATGALMFLALTVAVAVAAETVRPEWRDPEYGHRLREVRRWQRKRPARPLVLVFGSSRAQMGVSPAAAGFPDAPGSPLVYNFGYRGAHPLGTCFQVARALDDGVRPRAVLVVVSAVELTIDGPADEQFPTWGPRLSGGDLRRFAPYTENASAFRRDLAAARRDPWAARREVLMNILLPDWQSERQRNEHDGWVRMDRYGFAPFPAERLTPGLRQHIRDAARGHAFALDGAPPGQMPLRALRDVAARCRAGGTALAVAWAPESPAYRSLYTPAGRASVEAVTRQFATELGAAVFPAPAHLQEDDFADGYHLMPDGAAKYSRWLADNHLKPWLAEVLK